MGLWLFALTQGLLADQIDRSTGAEASSRLSVGAASDSTYEYLLKHWLLLGKQVILSKGYKEGLQCSI